MPMKPAVMASPRILMAAMIVAAILSVLVLLGALQFAFGKLGLSPQLAVWIFVAAALGSMVNLPVLTVGADAEAQEAKRQDRPGELLLPSMPPPGRMLVAVNLGGCVVPLVFSLFLVGHAGVDLPQLIAASMAVGVVAYGSSALVPGVGIIMPMMAVPIAAALFAQGIDTANAAPLAYASATLAVFFGADVARLRGLGRAGESAVAIGGAGCFDGIFLAGILSVVLV